MVVNSPVTTNGLETGTINGEEMKQPIINYRTGNLHFTNWLANCETACANYTVFLRFRNESVNPVPGNDNRQEQPQVPQGRVKFGIIGA
jgi:hypothetical protein